MRARSPRRLYQGLRDRRRLAQRRAFHEAARPLTSMLSVDAGARGRYLVRTDDLHIGRSLFETGQRQEMPALERAIALIGAAHGGAAFEDKTILDIGANIGTTTVPALLSGAFRRGIAVEPEPQNHVVLRLNLVLNGLDDHVEAVRAAAGEGSGSARLVVTSGRSGNHRLAAGGGETGIQVDVVSVDELIESRGIAPGAVGLLWIDAEGSEDRVLAGASRVLEGHAPVVLELSPAQVERAGGSQSSLEQTLAGSYSHFAPLELPPAHSEEVRFKPIAELPAFSQRVADRSLGKKKVDILALSLDSSPPDDRRVAELLGIQSGG